MTLDPPVDWQNKGPGDPRFKHSKLSPKQWHDIDKKPHASRGDASQFAPDSEIGCTWKELCRICIERGLHVPTRKENVAYYCCSFDKIVGFADGEHTSSIIVQWSIEGHYHGYPVTESYLRNRKKVSGIIPTFKIAEMEQ